MQGQNKERWQELCALAVKEQDPEKLVELTGEIVRLLQDKLDRISGVPVSSQPKSSDSIWFRTTYVVREAADVYVIRWFSVAVSPA